MTLNASAIFRRIFQIRSDVVELSGQAEHSAVFFGELELASDLLGHAADAVAVAAPVAVAGLDDHHDPPQYVDVMLLGSGGRVARRLGLASQPPDSPVNLKDHRAGKPDDRQRHGRRRQTVARYHHRRHGDGNGDDVYANRPNKLPGIRYQPHPPQAFKHVATSHLKKSSPKKM
jgi:hypothetical protein